MPGRQGDQPAGGLGGLSVVGCVKIVVFLASSSASMVIDLVRAHLQLQTHLTHLT